MHLDFAHGVDFPEVGATIHAKLKSKGKVEIPDVHTDTGKVSFIKMPQLPIGTRIVATVLRLKTKVPYDTVLKMFYRWWASLMWGVVLSMMVFAGLVTLTRREAQRAFWSGYLVAGIFYLWLLMYADGKFLPLNRSHLITTRVIVWAYSAFPASKTEPFLPSPAGMMPGGSGPGMTGGAGMPGMGGMPPGMGMAPPATPNPNYIDGNDFMQVGHALWMLVLSWLSGTVALCLYRTREKSSTAGASARATTS